MHLDQNDVVRFDEAETARFAREMPGQPVPRRMDEIIDDLIDWIVQHSE